MTTISIIFVHVHIQEQLFRFSVTATYLLYNCYGNQELHLTDENGIHELLYFLDYMPWRFLFSRHLLVR